MRDDGSPTERLSATPTGRYSIEREIGSGGMATVYLARDLKHDREVALKVLRPDLSAVIGAERFLAEVRITARLDHPHILTLIDSGEADGILYYVLPYVRGESLKAKLDREKQLSISEALLITKQVASALDYAHSQGVVHRDIKPENILLHEGEAVLADFGIALAVEESGGNRLTETGLSLGTPQYMSPEQATGDRSLDKRSDIYSLGAVFYEMLSGEPPVTGGTAQAMIAKLLTEKPVKLRVLRQTVPDVMEAATEKALAKIPADRFQSAGEFARALEAASTSPDVVKVKGGSAKWIAAGLAVVAAIAAVFYIARDRRAEAPAEHVSLRDRVQLTNTGNARLSTISGDGKMLAYVVTTCSRSGCRYAIEIKDVGGSGSRRLLDGATAIYRMDISPDRRNLLFTGSLNARFGTYLISLVGGEPRYISTSAASFYAGGDSLLVSPGEKLGSRWMMLVAGLDGAPVDSVPVSVDADAPPYFAQVPGSDRIAVFNMKSGALSFTGITRRGDVLSTKSLPRGYTRSWVVTHDAVWAYHSLAGRGAPQIVRVGFDSATMKFEQKADTVYSGDPTWFDVTSDGGTLVLDDGVADYSVWVQSIDDIVNDRFTDDKRIVRGTGGLHGAISPDGQLAVIGRDASDGGIAWSAISDGSKAEIPIPGRHNSAVPQDSETIKMSDVTDEGLLVYLYNVRTRERSAQSVIKDMWRKKFTRAGNAWAWVPSGGRAIRIRRDGESSFREVKVPESYKSIFWVAGSTDGSKVAFVGWKNPSEASNVSVGILNLADNTFTLPMTKLAEDATATWLDDGGLLVTINDTPESVSFYRLRPDGKVSRLGSTPRVVDQNNFITASADMKKAFMISRDDRRDIWMNKVVR
jgi:serine/threonine protein kinase